MVVISRRSPRRVPSSLRRQTLREQFCSRWSVDYVLLETMVKGKKVGVSSMSIHSNLLERATKNVEVAKLLGGRCRVPRWTRHAGQVVWELTRLL